jgi:hypothetical protein
MPQLDRIKSIESNLMNQTDAFRGIQPQLPSEPSP